MDNVLELIYRDMVSHPDDVSIANDLYYMSIDVMKGDMAEGVRWLKKLSEHLMGYLPEVKDDGVAVKLYELHKKTLLKAAPEDFDSYMLYLEWNREPDKKFYPPRRKQLMPIVDALQGIEEDKYDLVCISMPPGTGKSTTAIFYLCWVAGRHPDKPILGGSHSNSFLRGVYDECLRVIDGNGGEYLWREIFPGVELSETNAKDMRIDLGKPKRFQTLEFSSIGSANAGKVRAESLLYADDLVDGLETALSKERLDKLWNQYTVDLKQRKIGKCRELMIATRWSVHDPIGRLQRQYEDDPRCKFLVFPALNENDESNFDYPCDAGFTTEFYHQQRDIMDDISWKALYQNEPIEREGQLYAPEELRRYFELPDAAPDGIIAVCDTKDRGSDYCVMPIGYMYGDNLYIEDVVCDNGKPELVEAKLVEMLLKHNVHMACFESNSAGGRIAEKVQTEIKARGGRTKIITKYTTSNKETKILTHSPYVKEHFLFKDLSECHDKEYKSMLDQLSGYTMMGRNKHDDVPDAMAQLAEYVQTFGVGQVSIFKRPW